MARAELPDYVDAHAWTFTPSSFELLILELRALGLLDLAVERIVEAPLTGFTLGFAPARNWRISTRSSDTDRAF